MITSMRPAIIRQNNSQSLRTLGLVGAAPCSCWFVWLISMLSPGLAARTNVMLARVEEILRPKPGSWNSCEYYARSPLNTSPNNRFLAGASTGFGLDRLRFGGCKSGPKQGAGPFPCLLYTSPSPRD